MSGAALVAALLAAAWLAWRLIRLKGILRREQEENRRLRGLLQTGSRLAQADLEQLRRLRHDLRQYLILAEHSPLPGEGEAPELGAGCPPPAAGRESWALSTLERYYLERAVSLGIQADLRILPPHAWEEATPDLCLVLSNLLENGLEALEREGGGWLRARSISAAGYFSLVVGNSCTRPLRTVNGRYLSSKSRGGSASDWKPSGRWRSGTAARRSSLCGTANSGPRCSCRDRTHGRRRRPLPGNTRLNPFAPPPPAHNTQRLPRGAGAAFSDAPAPTGRRPMSFSEGSAQKPPL